MGYNTTVFILNDGFDQLMKYPEEFVQKIRDRMDYGDTIGVGNHCNVAEVMRTEHADVFRLYCTHQNAMLELSPWSKDVEKYYKNGKDFQRDYVKRQIAQAKTQLKELEKQLEQWDAEIEPTP